MKPRIYCDMDGVLCDFKTAAQKATGMPITKWMYSSKTEKWQPIKDTPKFWHTMPWQAGGRSLWSFISKYKPHILSAYVEESFDPNCIPGKRAWLRKNPRITDRSKINLVRRKEKKNFATKGGKKNILIDDYIKNVREFTSAGGIGIHHTSTTKTLSELKKLGIE